MGFQAQLRAGQVCLGSAVTLLSFPFRLALRLMIRAKVVVQGWDGEPWGTDPKLVVGQQHPLAQGFPAAHPWVRSQTWPVLRPC